MGDAAELYDESYADLDDDQPSEGRCMYCGSGIWWELDVEGLRWVPIDNRSRKRHFCKAMIPAPEQDFEVLT